MDRKKSVDAYNKLLNAMLDYLQGKDVIDYKQSTLIMKYCKQDDSSKKLVDRLTI